MTGAIGGLFTERKLDQAAMNELEDALITADIGCHTPQAGTPSAKTRFDKEVSEDEIRCAGRRDDGNLEPVSRTAEQSTHAHSRSVILGLRRQRIGQDHDHRQAAKQFKDEGKS